MDKRRAWFFGWVVTRKGSKTSGNWGHKGVKGQHGGSAPGGGHAAIGIVPGAESDDVESQIDAYREMEDYPSGTPADIADGVDQRALDAWAEGVRDYDILNTGFSSSITDAGDSWSLRTTERISQETGIAQDDVLDTINMWRRTSNDNNEKALSFQEAVSEELGIPLSEWQKGKIQDIKSGKISGGTDVPLPRDQERAIARSMYNETQRQFQEAGYGPEDTIRLYRGVGVPVSLGATTGEVTAMNQNTISSWSLLADPIADNFANNASYRDGIDGVVLAMNVPVKNIFSTTRSGLGTAWEGEFVVLGVPSNQAAIGRVIPNVNLNRKPLL